MIGSGDQITVGYADPTQRVQNIPIPKNGSTYFSTHVQKIGWQFKSFLYTKNISRFVILRDPYARWISGLTEDIEVYRTQSGAEQFQSLFENSNGYWFFDFLIDKDILAFDVHANLQINHIKSVIDYMGLDNLTFFKLNDRLGDALNHWLGTKNILSQFTNQKIHTRNAESSIVYKRILEYLSDPKNINRKQKVMEYLKPDYELIQSVKFANFS